MGWVRKTAKQSNNIARGRAAHPGSKHKTDVTTPKGLHFRDGSVMDVSVCWTPSGFQAFVLHPIPGCAARPRALM
jgi:hypothetical protein